MCHSQCETSDQLLVNGRATSFRWETLQVKTGYHHSFNDLKVVVTSIMHQNRATRKNIIITISSVAILGPSGQKEMVEFSPRNKVV